MTHSELLGVMHGQLTQLSYQCSHMMSILGGMIRRIEGADPGDISPDDAPPDYGIYRGISVAYAPVRVVRPTGREDEEAGASEPYMMFDPPALIPGEPIPAATINWIHRKAAERAREAVESAWRDRLAFDFEVSDVSPVIRGTWVTVRQVVSMIVEGRTWADILRTHPELTEDDIRAALAYAVDEAERGDG